MSLMHFIIWGRAEREKERERERERENIPTQHKKKEREGQTPTVIVFLLKQEMACLTLLSHGEIKMQEQRKREG
jgi:hypothetical protein